MRPRWAPHSGTISIIRSSLRHRSAGRVRGSIRPIRRSRRAPSRCRATWSRRPSCRAGSPRSASSTALRVRGSPASSNPASGWSRAKAIYGAGTGLRRRRTPRPRRRGGWRSATGSALAEAKIRLAASRDEAVAAKRDVTEALAALPAAAGLEAELARVSGEVSEKRATLAEARGEAQALAREAELRERRLEAIAAEQTEWQERANLAKGQIATLDLRSAEALTERQSLDAAPAVFAEKRRALIDEIEAAEARRRAAADELAAAEARLADADRAARAALDKMGQAREEAARAEERFAGARNRLGDIAHEIQELLEVGPERVAALAGIGPGEALPELVEVEAEVEKLRRDRERLGAVNLRAEEELREVE